MDRIRPPRPQGAVLRLHTLKTRGRRAAKLPGGRRIREAATRRVDLVMARVCMAARAGSTEEPSEQGFSRFFSEGLPSCPTGGAAGSGPSGGTLVAVTGCGRLLRT